jgi:hypothetical protein
MPASSTHYIIKVTIYEDNKCCLLFTNYQDGMQNTNAHDAVGNRPTQKSELETTRFERLEIGPLRI